jgi:hypothetical protein
MCQPVAGSDACLGLQLRAAYMVEAATASLLLLLLHTLLLLLLLLLL